MTDLIERVDAAFGEQLAPPEAEDPGARSCRGIPARRSRCTCSSR